MLSNLCIVILTEILLILGGPYAAFAGRDASRGLATFSVNEDALRDGYDDLSDLGSSSLDSMREWEMQFKGEPEN